MIYGNHDNPVNFDEYLLGNNIIKTDLLKTEVANFLFINSLKHGFDSGEVTLDDIEILDEMHSHGIKTYSSLSTCIQFAKSYNLFFENKKPGFTVYNILKGKYEVISATI